MKIKGIIFDLDGTLLNTLEDLGDSVNELLLRYNLSIHSIESYKKFVGNGVDVLIKRAFPEHILEKLNIKILVKELRDIYSQRLTKKTTVYNGISELLDYLTESGVCLNVLSNKPDYETKLLINYYFNNYKFNIIMGANDIFPKKPCPDAPLYIARENRITPQEIICLGDSDVDMQTAKNANMYAIGATWGFRDKYELLKNGADFIINSPVELIHILKRL